MKRLILLHIVVLVALCLTLRTHCPLIPGPPKQTTPATDPKTVLLSNPKYLLFMDELNKITNEAGFIQRTIEINFAKHENCSNVILNLKKYNTGIEAVRKVLTKYNLFIHQKEKSCPNPTSFNKSEIYRYINFTAEQQSLVLRQIQ